MYKTILTYLPSAASAGLLSSIGADLAARFQADLIGAHNSAHIKLYGGIPADYLAEHHQRQREEAEAIEQSFATETQARGVSAHWRHKALRDTEAFSDIVAAARSADLVIAGGKGEHDPLGRWYDLPIRLVLETGRPVLLVPASDGVGAWGDRVTVAWNHSRESARAAFDALPLLKMASAVNVLAINPTRNGGEDPAEDLVESLARHGVNAEAQVTTTTKQSDSEELMSELSRTGSDLLVMGCYGRSRLREMVLGGVTNYVLHHMTTPVLMSH